MLTATIIVARVQPGTSKGITDLLLPQPSSVLKRVGGPSSLHFTLLIPMTSQILNYPFRKKDKIKFVKKSRGNSSPKDERKVTRGCDHVRCLQGYKGCLKKK